jgi:hypothetical protein
MHWPSETWPKYLARATVKTFAATEAAPRKFCRSRPKPPRAMRERKERSEAVAAEASIPAEARALLPRDILQGRTSFTSSPLTAENDTRPPPLEVAAGACLPLSNGFRTCDGRADAEKEQEKKEEAP